MSRFLSKTSKALLPYTPGEQPQGVKLIKLNTNESPYPPSPNVARALLQGFKGCEWDAAAAKNADAAGGDEALSLMPPEIANLRLYSDPEEKPLMKAIADYYGVDSDQVIGGNGSDEILAFAFKAFCDEEAPLLSADITYGFYPALCQLFGIPYRTAALREDFSIDIEDYKNCGCNVIIANPNAPTGMAMPLSAIEEVLSSNPDRVVMVDEAYVDFGCESAVTLLDRYENLVVIQTFSKSRSLAGGRVGFAVASKELIADMNRAKYSFNPYNVNRLSMLAAAEAMKDKEYTKLCTGKIQKTRERTAQALTQLGFTVLPSKTNFIFAKCNAMSGKEYFDGLRRNNILVRRWDTEKIREYLRISIGTDEEMDIFLEVTKKLLSEKEAE